MYRLEFKVVAFLESMFSIWKISEVRLLKNATLGCVHIFVCVVDHV
jgi:hypothetical protein